MLEYCTCFSFFENQPTKKKKRKKLEKLRTLYLVSGMRITLRTLWTTKNTLEMKPAAKGRENEEQMRRLHVCFFGLVVTCDVPGTCPTQKLPLLLNLIQMGPRKNKNSYFGDPHTWEVF